MTETAKILLVDDRQENLLALEAILSPLGQDLVPVTSGEEALRALLKDDFALILLDAHMPGMDGFETATRIKQRFRTKQVPIIFLTAFHDDPRSTYQGYMAGGADYLTKPFDPWILRTKVQVFVDLWEAGRRMRPPAPPRQCAGARGLPAASLRDRLAAVEAALAALSTELAQNGAAPPSALSRVERQVASLRETVEALLGPAPASGPE